MKPQWQSALDIAQNARRCGAKTRKRTSCQSPAMTNGRCRMHGGKSPGAPTGHRHGMYKHGKHTKEHLAIQIFIKNLIKHGDEIIRSSEK